MCSHTSSPRRCHRVPAQADINKGARPPPTPPLPHTPPRAHRETRKGCVSCARTTEGGVTLAIPPLSRRLTLPWALARVMERTQPPARCALCTQTVPAYVFPAPPHGRGRGGAGRGGAVLEAPALQVQVDLGRQDWCSIVRIMYVSKRHPHLHAPEALDEAAHESAGVRMCAMHCKIPEMCGVAASAPSLSKATQTFTKPKTVNPQRP